MTNMSCSRKDDQGTAQTERWRQHARGTVRETAQTGSCTKNWRKDGDTGQMKIWRKAVYKDRTSIIEEKWRPKDEKKSENHQSLRRPNGKWSSLPTDILSEIFRRLHNFADHIAMHTTCFHWRSSTLLHYTLYPESFPAPVSRLLLPQYEPNPQLLYYNVNSKKIDHMLIPNLNNHYCCTAHKGWLVLLDYSSPSMFLFNPLINISIKLPPLTAFPGVLSFDPSNNEYILKSSLLISLDPLPSAKHLPDPQPSAKHLAFMGSQCMHLSFIQKVVLSSNPTPTNYTAMAIYGKYPCRKLAICKSGHNKWTKVIGMEQVHDIVHYKGEFYACNAVLFKIFNVDDGSPSPRFTPIARLVANFPLVGYASIENYLVELAGNLILVQHRNRGLRFQVFGFDDDTQEWLWLESLGNHSLYIGFKSVSSSPRCRPNCIYFRSEDKTFGFGIFSLETNSLEKYFLEQYRQPYPSFNCPISSEALWFTPSFS